MGTPIELAADHLPADWTMNDIERFGFWTVDEIGECGDPRLDDNETAEAKSREFWSAANVERRAAMREAATRDTK